MATKTLDIVFDGAPGPEGPRFVEVERGITSINFGEWVEREDGFHVLRIPDPESERKAGKLEAYDAAIDILQSARMGEIDTDLRSIISRIEGLKPAL